MGASITVKQMLEKEKITYELLEHPTAFTAMEIAQAQHIVGRDVIKAVIIKTNDKLLMCVLPATHLIDFTKLKAALNTNDIQLATEGQVAMLFPNFEVGAMPPFGQLANLKVYADKSLEENESVVFNAGSHREMIKIKFKDYLRLVKPTFADIGKHI